MVQPIWKTVWQSSQTKYSLIIWSRNSSLWYLPRGVENVCPYKNWHMNFYSRLIPNCQNLEATKMSFSRQIDKKPWYIQTREYYSVLKRNELSRHENIWRALKCILLNERRQSKKATCCMIPTMWLFWKRQNYEDSKKICGFQEPQGKRRIRGAQKISKEMKMLCMIL